MNKTAFFETRLILTLLLAIVFKTFFHADAIDADFVGHLCFHFSAFVDFLVIPALNPAVYDKLCAYGQIFDKTRVSAPSYAGKIVGFIVSPVDSKQNIAYLLLNGVVR